MTVVLQRFGYDADDLSSDRTQSEREKVMERVRKGSLRFLVATDVAARGIDLPELSHVFQYEPPEDPEAYIHRAGRTGRAGGSGTADLARQPRGARRPASGSASATRSSSRSARCPEDEDVERIVSERIITLLEARLRNRDRLQTERMQRFIPLARTLGESEEPDLLAMLLDDFYQETFHAPLVPPEQGDATPAQRAASRSKRPHSERGGGGRGGGSRGGGGGGSSRGPRGSKRR